MSYYFLLRPVANSEVSRHKSLFEEKVPLFSTSWKLVAKCAAQRV